ncbi:MAG: MGMT family protein [Haliea sp.]
MPSEPKTFTMRLIQVSEYGATVTPQEPDINQRIWQVVALIPAGRVATYGDVAQHAGLGRAARRVGRALRQLPEDTRIPWHRVINSTGRLSLPAASAAGKQQRQRLTGEGIDFCASGRVNLRQMRWRPESGPAGNPACQ